jgi:hypothetical protein
MWERGERQGIQECLVIQRHPLMGPPTIAHYLYERTGRTITWTHVQLVDPDAQTGGIHDAIHDGFAKRRALQPEIDRTFGPILKEMKQNGFSPEESVYWSDRGLAIFLSKQPGVFLVQYLGSPEVTFQDGKAVDPETL